LESQEAKGKNETGEIFEKIISIMLEFTINIKSQIQEVREYKAVYMNMSTHIHTPHLGILNSYT
jgi:hypothetical protein